MVQNISPSSSVARVLKEFGSIQEFLRKHNPDPDAPYRINKVGLSCFVSAQRAQAAVTDPPALPLHTPCLPPPPCLDAPSLPPPPCHHLPAAACLPPLALAGCNGQLRALVCRVLRHHVHPVRRRSPPGQSAAAAGRKAFPHRFRVRGRACGLALVPRREAVAAEATTACPCSALLHQGGLAMSRPLQRASDPLCAPHARSRPSRPGAAVPLAGCVVTSSAATPNLTRRR